MEMAKADGV
jgi:hypothetical protein